MSLRDWLTDLEGYFGSGTPVDSNALPVLKRKADESVVNLEALRAYPHRHRGAVQTATLEAFAEICRQFDAFMVRNIYQDAKCGSFCCLFNDDSDTAGWRDHKAVFEPAHDESWAAWLNVDGKMFEQLDIAEFIQVRAPDFVTPDAATMLELATNFDVVRGGRFASGVHLSSGMTRLTVENTAASTTLDIPEVVELGVRIFWNEQAYKVGARLRWRILDGRLKIGFKIIDRDKLERSAIEDLGKKAKRLLPNNKHVLVRGFPSAVTALGSL